jgi:hypothetical protein
MEKGIISNGLVLYLPLWKRDGYNIRSDDAYGHACAITEAYLTPQGRRFDGTNDFINCGANAALNLTDRLTVGGWVNLKGRIAAGNPPDIIGRAETYKGWGLQLPAATNYSVYLRLGKGGAWVISPTYSISLDTWTFFMGVYDGKTISLFVNGESYGTPTAHTTGIDAPIAATACYIGTHYSGGAGFANMIAGDLFLYNRALTPQEIRQNYTSTKWHHA